MTTLDDDGRDEHFEIQARTQAKRRWIMYETGQDEDHIRAQLRIHREAAANRGSEEQFRLLRVTRSVVDS